jgi:hypothetical protein
MATPKAELLTPKLAHQNLSDSPSVCDVTFKLDSTKGSLLHRAFGYSLAHEAGSKPSLIKAYLVAVGITYFPLLLASLLGPLPLLDHTSSLRLPFFLDWNVFFWFLVSFPCLVAFIVTDQRVLQASLQQVQVDGILTISPKRANALQTKWEARFYQLNVWACGIGFVMGSLVAVANFVTYTPASVGFWIASEGSLVPAGYVYLYCVCLFYVFTNIYVVRGAGISFLLKDLVANSDLRLMPFHPDHCGGLQPVGRLGLRNQYVLTILGFNMVLLILVTLRNLNVSRSVIELIVAAAVAYLVVGPLVFMGPLLPFRGGMLRTKARLLGEVAHRIRIELQRLHAQLNSGSITEEDEKLIDRLRKVGTVIDELPVWPFDVGTLRKFLTAYVIPLIGAFGYPLFKAILEALVLRLQGKH